MPKGKTEVMRLADVLREAGRPLTPEQLLRNAGYTVDSIDEFYEALKHEVDVGKSIEEIRPNKTEVLLRLVE